jgi:uncharacterized protein (TIGR03435 family)
MAPMQAPKRFPSCILIRLTLATIGVAAFAAAGLSVLAQTEPSKLPEFDVATIKPTSPEGTSNSGVQVFPGGRVIINAVSLRGLIDIAFNMNYWQISGGEPWTEQATFNLEAKPSGDLQPPVTDLSHSYWTIGDPRLRLMLQAVLLDRFQLKYHHETRTGPVFLLQRSGKRIPLIPAKQKTAQGQDQNQDQNQGQEQGQNQGQPGHKNDIPLPQQSEVDFTDNRWFLFNTTMPQLAQFAGNYIVHQPVLDMTELNGAFDYKSPTQIELAPDSASHQVDLPGAFPALLREIGLKLTPSKGPVEYLVIDSAQKPTAN